MAVLEQFQKIFDLKKIEEYVAVIEKSAQAEIEANKRAKLNQALQSGVASELRKIGDEVKNRHGELLNVITNVLARQTDDDNEYLLDLMPLNHDLLLRGIAEIRKSPDFDSTE